MPIWIIFSFIASIFSATAAIIEKHLLHKIHPVVFTLIFSIFTFLFSLPLIPLSPSLNKLTPVIFLVIGLKALLECIQFTSVMWGIKHFGLSTALPMMVTVPGITAILAWPLLGDALSSREITGLVILLLGTYLLQIRNLSKPLSPFHITAKQTAPILIAITANTLAALLDRSLLSGFKINPLHYLIFQHLFMVLILLAVIPFLKLALPKLSALKPALIFFLALALVTIVYRYSQMRAVMIAPVALVLAIRRTSVLFATIAAGTLFKEKNILQKSLAVIAMLFGVFLLAQTA